MTNSQTPANYRAVALISGAHLYSHAFILLLPPLFPLIKDDLDVGFTELGLSITVFSLVTGLTQAPIGFLVDRLGARALLIAALVVESLAFVVFGFAPSYAMLLVMMVAAGLANAVYHPADYAILNASVGERHMGRAFSVHTASGFFGGFLAPAAAIPLAAVYGWQVAVMTVAATGLLMACVVLAGASALRHERVEPDPDTSLSAGQATSGIALLFTAPILMGLLFYVGISAFGHGISDFSVAALGTMYPAELASLGLVLGAWLLASPIGVLAGGWVADSIRRHDRFAAACFVGIAALLFVVAGAELPLVGVALLFFAAGLLNGAVSPSRDMLIRSMTPPGQMGKVFGFVSTGFNVGGILAPPMFGYLLDHGNAPMVFWVAGCISLLTVPTVLMTGARGRRQAADRAELAGSHAAS